METTTTTVTTTISIATQLQPLNRDEQPSLDYLLKDTPKNIKDAPLSAWDAGVFDQELVALKIAPKQYNLASLDVPTTSEENEGQISEGTWAGTQLALTEMYSRIEKGYDAFFIATGLDAIVPQVISDRAKLFKWSNGDDDYPPHLHIPRGGGIPEEYDASIWAIFSVCGLLNAKIMLTKIAPKTFWGRVLSAVEEVAYGRSDQGASMKDLENNNKENRKSAVDVMKGQNLGDLPDWFSDAKFAQQSFTGTNPNTISLASNEWIARFKEVAKVQNESPALDFIDKADRKALFLQDCSYFREALKVGPTVELNAQDRYNTAAVTLFHLPPNGRLHPLAIVIDWRGSIKESVTIFNRRLAPLDPESSDYEYHLNQEKNDWPWRYAKTCAQVSDWVRHELAIHLVNTHMIEEVIIVAANRDAAVECRCERHLVPAIIFELVGFGGPQPKNFIKHAFAHFNFTANYAPQELESRSFSETELSSPRLKNYPYAQNISKMWHTICKFVSAMIQNNDKKDDVNVANDRFIQSWCKQVQQDGQVPTFPTIRTSDQLIDAITMCIHVASPQHTAINYLQNFYMGFVPNKPPCLYTPVPKTREELNKIDERGLLKALPVGHQREWLLATQVPWLLSYKTAEQTNLITYSESLYNLVRKKDGWENQRVKEIAKVFYGDLVRLIEEFKASSDAMTKDTVPYVVMNPGNTAVSILI